jgi:hypothetical protein
MSVAPERAARRLARVRDQIHTIRKVSVVRRERRGSAFNDLRDGEVVGNHGFWGSYSKLPFQLSTLLTTPV